MTSRRVFVIWSHPIFHESLRRLLNHPAIRWMGAASDHNVAHDLILRLQPDTILIEETDGGRASAEVLGILEISGSDVRVIRLSMADNELSVYHRELRALGHAEDLLRLITED